MWATTGATGVDAVTMFGGLGIDTQLQFGPVNDMWEFAVQTDSWQMIGTGVAAANGGGVYGSASAPATYNQLAWADQDMVPWPGPRSSAASWSDAVGNLYLFGGQGFDGGTPPRDGKLNDLWKYTIAGVWEWVGGEPVRDKNGKYGEIGVASGNACRGLDAYVAEYNCVFPGARSEAAAWRSAPSTSPSPPAAAGLTQMWLCLRHR